MNQAFDVHHFMNTLSFKHYRVPNPLTLIGIRRTLAAIAISAFSLCNAVAQVMVVGIDRKFAYDSNAVRQALEPGNDEVLFFDVKSPLRPRLLGSLKLENSILGPPTNVAVTPDQSTVLIANAVHSERTPTGWATVPSDEVFVVDLSTGEPKHVQTVKVGRQPSGIAISRDGRFALVANRDSKSISVLRLAQGAVSVADTFEAGDSIGAIAISPDGHLAIGTKTNAHKVTLIHIGADLKLSDAHDLWAGLYPWNVAISPDGATALVSNIGNGGQSDGGMKTVSVIDLAAAVPHVSQHASVGDGPEGMVFSPRGDLAALTILQGSYDAPPSAWYRHEVGKATLLSVHERSVRVVNSVDVGAFPEGIAFAADGVHVFVGNYRSNSISILKVDRSGRLVDTKMSVNLPGPPASLRIGSQ